MKYLDDLTALLGKPVSAKDFELYHHLKMLKIEVSKLEMELRRSKNDKLLTESLLNSTIKDLKVSNQKIRELRRVELDANAKELEFRDSQLEQITQSMTSSMSYIDADYVYRYINYKYEEWFGFKREELVGKTAQELAPELFKMLKPIYDNVMNGERYEFELDTVIPSGKRMVFRNTYIPAYDPQGNNIGLYIYATDITEIKLKTEAEEETRKELADKNVKLEQYIQSNVQLEQFAHIAAHDMRAPLRTISSFTGILEKRLADSLEEDEKTYITYVKEGTKTLSAMITDLLNYSVVKSQGIKITEFNLESLIKQILVYLEKNISESKSKIVLGAFPKTIKADRIKMYQVFQNLISNAIKFSDKNELPMVRISSVENDHEILFKIEDNGIGIPAEKRKEIFQPFKQLNTKQKYKGTGLGLAICKRIINDHGGDIRVEESPLGGTTMAFTIKKNLEA